MPTLSKCATRSTMLRFDARPSWHVRFGVLGGSHGGAALPAVSELIRSAR